MAKDFKLTEAKNFKGYQNKHDITSLGDNYLVKESQNVVSTVEGRLGTRKGFTIFGASDTTTEPITGEMSWKTARGDEIVVRHRNDGSTAGTGEFYITSIGEWTEFYNGLGTTQFQATTDYWDTTEAQDALLFVVGDANIYYWSGGVTTFASATANTITKEGTTSWLEEGFITGGTTQVTINGTVYTYTGGEDTTILTGVSPDPTAGGHTIGDTVFQTVRTTSNKPASGLSNDLIAVHRNQLYIGDLTRQDINISKVGDYTNYTTATVPRVVGESAVITPNEPPTAFIAQEDNIYISTFNQWYNVVWTLSDDLSGEAVSIRLLKSSPRGGAINQNSVFKIKNDILYISNEPTINSLGRVENVDTPQSKDLSDPIKLELESYTTTNCSGKFWLNNAYFNFPSEGKTLVFNIEKGYWEAPQILPVRVMSVFEGDLIGHSNSVVESYKMFDGTNDNGNAMEAKAVFSYLDYGTQIHQKGFTEWATVGLISSNTLLKQTINYDYKGYTRVQEFEIKGDDTKIIFALTQGGNLGKKPLGHNPLGSTGDEVDTLQKFRVIKVTNKTDFYEVQNEYLSNDIDQQWQLLVQGSNVSMSKSDNFGLKQ